MKLQYIVSLVLCIFCLCKPAAYAASNHDEIQLLLQQNRFKDALELTEKQLKKDDSDVKLLFLKGLIHTRMDDLDSAEKVFLGLTNSHPELPEPYNNLAVVYAARGDFDKAENALKRAINTHPSYATAQENLGDIYAKMASLAYNQALQLDEDNITAREKLSTINNLFSVEVNEEQVIASLKKQNQEDFVKAEKARDELTRIEKEIANAEKKASQVSEEAKQTRRDLEAIQKKRKTVVEELQSKQNQKTEELKRVQEVLEKARQELVKAKEEKQKLVESSKREKQLNEEKHNELMVAQEKLKKARQELVKAKEEKQKLVESSKREKQLNEEKHNELMVAQKKLKKARQELENIESEKEKLTLLSQQEAMKIEAARAELDKVVTGDDLAIQQDIISTVYAWAESWSAQDVDQYLSYYAQDFSTPNGLPRKSWEDYRRQRLLKPRFIKVDIQNPEVSVLGKEQARVKFVQSYQSNTYSDRVTKIVVLKRENDHWLIIEEKSGN